MGPSNININIFILIRYIKNKYFYVRGVPGGGVFDFIIRDRTYKHKNQYFYINHINPKNIFCKERAKGRGWAIVLFSLFLEIEPLNININIFISVKDMYLKKIFLRAYQGGRSAKYIYILVFIEELKTNKKSKNL